MKVVLLPLKEPVDAKQRLSGLLTRRQRQTLYWAMLEDVGEGLREARVPESIVVVTSSVRVADFARAREWKVLLEDDQTSESASVDRASETLFADGVTSILRIPGDVPLLRGEDVDALWTRGEAPPPCVLVPSLDGTGTNAILRTAAAVFPSRFGPDSLRLHRMEAHKREIDVEIVENPRLALDVDTPGDIDLLLEAEGGPETRRFLSRMVASISGSRG